MDYDKITKALKTMTPEQIQLLMEEFANAVRGDGNMGQQQQMQPPDSVNPVHPTQTPGAVMRRQMMQQPQQQPMGLLNRGY